jgi:hypothetical protein
MMTVTTVSKIQDVIEKANGAAFAAIRSALASLCLHGTHRRFLVNRMGSTGSSWLSKLLNSHPDVFCSHETVVGKVFPAQSYGNEEILALIRQLAEIQLHGAYSAVGDVGSTWLGHVTNLPEQTFTTAMLVRHPARLLYSRLTRYATDQAFTPLAPALLDQIEEIWGINVSGRDPLDQIFVQDAYTFASQVRGLGKVDLLIRLEDMNQMENALAVLERLTGLEYPSDLVKQFIDKPINTRAGAHAPVGTLIESFSVDQKRWYRQMLGDLLPHFGYLD